MIIKYLIILIAIFLVLSCNKDFNPISNEIKNIEPEINPAIVFTSHRDKNNEIYVMDIDGKNQINISNDSRYDNYPSVSPNGDFIVFERDMGYNIEIFIMDTNGKNQTNLTNSNQDEYKPIWSPDGSKILYFKSGGNTGLYLMDIDGSNKVQLTSEYNFDYSFSPDGLNILFVSRPFSSRNIFVINTDGNNLTKLSNIHNDFKPRYSPDGTKIVFVSTRDSDREIYLMNSDGSNPQNLSNSSEFDDDPYFTPDGSQIIFRSRRLDFQWDIYIMNADGSNQQRVTQSSIDETALTVSPDGKYFAFVRENEWDIYRVNLLNFNMVNLTNSPQVGDDDPIFIPK